jgi:transcriptional regulator with PAS, ATPase and Fis domain
MNTNTIDYRAELDKMLVGSSSVMQQLKHQVLQAADSHSPILIEGETGTGKELVARALHVFSPRADGPCLPINCATLQEQLLESELFGHQRGAFTGAVQNKPGLFRVANGGTLIMDEIGELPMPHQAKLLRVLETMEFIPIGATQPIQVDVRVVAATNRSLLDEMQDGKFRQDLYYRLGVVTLEIPPLRDRREDIRELAEYFLKTHVPDRKIILPDDAVAHLMNYHWPGNVRELFNALERSLIFLGGDELSVASLYIQTRTAVPLKDVTELATLDEVTREHIIRVLSATGNNKTKSAQILGVQRRQLYRLLETYKIHT